MDDNEKRARRRERDRRRKKERWDSDLEFRAKAKAIKNAWYDANKDEITAKLRARYAADPEYRAKKQLSWLRSKYGMSVDDFAAMLDQQHHACGICERPFTRKRKPCVDHCHVTGLVRGLLCHGCNLSLGHLEDNPVFALKAALYLVRWFQYLFQLLNTEENDMTSNDDTTEESKASRMMRKAILHELHQPHGVDPPPPTDRLEAVARALVDKAEAQDIQAIKEVLDRIDGKTPPAPTTDSQKQVNVSWKFPLSNLNPMQDSPKPPAPATSSSTKRARSSSPSTSGTSGSPAS
jgi:hypothetical protein